MKKSLTTFLQIIVACIGIAALAFMLLEPHVEGRNAHATLYQIYFNDPFLAYAYTASIAFFVAVYKAFRLLGYIRANQVFSMQSVNALGTIKYCAMLLVGFVAAPIAYLMIVRPGDDIAGGVAMGLMIMFTSTIIATTAAVLEDLLQKAVDLKSENDLTV